MSLSIYCMFLCWGMTASSGGLTVDRATIDAGQTLARKPLEQTFQLKNTSSQTIRITEVAAACGCVRRHLSRNELPPGASTELLVAINLHTQPAGPNSWSFTVRARTDQGPLPDLTLQVKADVRKEILLEPVSMVLITDNEATGKLQITDTRSGKSLSNLKARTGIPGVEVVPDEQMGQRQSFVVRVTATCPRGHHADELILTSNDPDYPELRLPLRITRREADRGVSANPAEPLIRFSREQTTASALIRLRDAADRPTEIASAESDLEGVECKWAAGPGRMSTLRITVNRSRVGDRRSAVVTVTLGQSSGEKVLIPVSWTQP